MEHRTSFLSRLHPLKPFSFVTWIHHVSCMSLSWCLHYNLASIITASRNSFSGPPFRKPNPATHCLASAFGNLSTAFMVSYRLHLTCHKTAPRVQVGQFILPSWGVVWPFSTTATTSSVCLCRQTWNAFLDDHCRDREPLRTLLSFGVLILMNLNFHKLEGFMGGALFSNLLSKSEIYLQWYQSL